MIRSRIQATSLLSVQGSHAAIKSKDLLRNHHWNQWPPELWASRARMVTLHSAHIWSSCGNNNTMIAYCNHPLVPSADVSSEILNITSKKQASNLYIFPNTATSKKRTKRTNLCNGTSNEKALERRWSLKQRGKGNHLNAGIQDSNQVSNAACTACMNFGMSGIDVRGSYCYLCRKILRRGLSQYILKFIAKPAKLVGFASFPHQFCRYFG